jgi:prophage regulatory protein
MQYKILRLPEVIHRTGKSRSSIYLGINEGTFVKPIKIGQRSIGFLERDINNWIEERIVESEKVDI